MSDATLQFNGKKVVEDHQMEAWRPAIPAWWVILSNEFTELWIGGKALYLILAFSVLLGIETFVLATNFELSLFSPQEMVLEIAKSGIQVSLLIGLIIGADSISGERERQTLEGLLLTPASRRQIVLGKYLAALSPWPVSLAITIPFMLLLSQGNAVFGQAIVLSGLVGLLLIPAFTALGMIVSFWCNSNKTSFFISLGVFLVFILLGQVLGPTKTGPVGELLLWINPIPAGFGLLSTLLVNGGLFVEHWTSLASPIVFAVVTIGLLFFFIGPGLSVEAGKVTRVWSRLARKVGLAMMAWLVIFMGVKPAMALHLSQSEGGHLGMTISLTSKTLKTGDSISFDTVLTNTGEDETPPVIVAMNIINLSKEGDVVDPEDWSPERTQYIDSLEPNQSMTLTWTVNAILDGNFMIYLVAISQPLQPESSGEIIVSPGFHLTVTKFTSLNPVGVLPYAIGTPLAVLAGIFILFRLRRRAVDLGGSE